MGFSPINQAFLGVFPQPPSSQVVLRFQAARGHDRISTGAGRHGILTALPQGEVERRWRRIREVFLDVKEGRGQNRKDGKGWENGGKMVGT